MTIYMSNAGIAYMLKRARKQAMSTGITQKVHTCECYLTHQESKLSEHKKMGA